MASLGFNKCIRRGQLDPSAFNFGGASDSKTIEDQGGEAVDSGVRTGRQSVKVESDITSKGAFGAKRTLSYSSEQLKDRAKCASQLAQAKASRVMCTVQGHQMPLGGVWGVNTLAQVNSDTADINRKMLVNTLTFSQGEGRPTVTAIEFVERNVYTINEKILSQRPAGTALGAFTPPEG